MNKCFSKSVWLMVSVIVICLVMAIIETVIEPAYFAKSILKIIFFLVIPIVFLKRKKEKVFADSFALNKKSVLKLLGLGLIIYVVIMAAFFLTKGIFDYNSLVNSLRLSQILCKVYTRPPR